MRTRWTGICLALALQCANASAHGIAQPKHGGLVDIGGEVTFELVRQKSGLTIHVEDHGKPVDMKGATGELLLGSETGKRLATLKEAGPSSVAAKPVALRSGDRLFVRITLGNGAIIVGEFAIK